MLGIQVSVEAEDSNMVETLSNILSSPQRGKLIHIIGREFESPYSKEVAIDIYTGTVTRILKTEKHYMRLYYITGNKEEYIAVHKDQYEKILLCIDPDKMPTGQVHS